MTLRVLQASAILKQASFSSSGSTDDCGIDIPQLQNGVSAWIWSPIHTMVMLPLGSISMSTDRAVTLSLGGHASIIPPG